MSRPENGDLRLFSQPAVYRYYYDRQSVRNSVGLTRLRKRIESAMNQARAQPCGPLARDSTRKRQVNGARLWFVACDTWQRWQSDGVDVSNRGPECRGSCHGVRWSCDRRRIRSDTPLPGSDPRDGASLELHSILVSVTRTWMGLLTCFRDRPFLMVRSPCSRRARAPPPRVPGVRAMVCVGGRRVRCFAEVTEGARMTPRCDVEYFDGAGNILTVPCALD